MNKGNFEWDFSLTQKQQLSLLSKEHNVQPFHGRIKYSFQSNISKTTHNGNIPSHSGIKEERTCIQTFSNEIFSFAASDMFSGDH